MIYRAVIKSSHGPSVFRVENPSYYFLNFSGEKPYPCRFCGRRFRTNYNKLGHEKKCPDRHSRSIDQPQPQPATGGRQENVVFR